MISGITDGISSYFNSVAVISKFRLWKYVILSGLISLTIAGVIIYFVLGVSDTAGDWLSAFYPFDWGRSFVEKALDFMTGGLLIMTTMFLYKYLVMIIVSPFMSLMSEAIERKMNPEYTSSQFNLANAISDMIRGLRLAIRNIIREIFFTLLLLLLGLFPIVTVAIPFAIFLLQSYYAGFGNLDYCLERHYDVKQSTRFVRLNKGLAIGNGAIFLLLLFIPVIGLILAPAFATVAGTTEVIKRLELNYGVN